MLSFITILYHTSLSERLFPSIKWTSRFCKLYNQHSLSLFQFTICRQSPEKKIDANAVKFDNACVVGFFIYFLCGCIRRWRPRISEIQDQRPCRCLRSLCRCRSNRQRCSRCTRGVRRRRCAAAGCRNRWWSILPDRHWRQDCRARHLHRHCYSR